MGTPRFLNTSLLSASPIFIGEMLSLRKGLLWEELCVIHTHTHTHKLTFKSWPPVPPKATLFGNSYWRRDELRLGRVRIGESPKPVESTSLQKGAIWTQHRGQTTHSTQ